jgi:hypothetical protein
LIPDVEANVLANAVDRRINVLRLTLVIISVAQECNIGKIVDQSETPGIIGGDFLRKASRVAQSRYFTDSG